MLGSFQILDDGQPRRRPDGGSLYWRGVFPRVEATIVPDSWDVAGLRGINRRARGGGKVHTRVRGARLAV